MKKNDSTSDERPEWCGRMDQDLRTKIFIRELERVSSAHSVVQVFADAVRAFHLALHRETLVFAPDKARALDEEFHGIEEKYGPAGMAHINTAFAMLMAALEERREDFLGHVLEAIGASNVRNGQFFTPTCVARMMAACNCGEFVNEPGRIVTILDPAGGAGVLPIEQAEYLVHERHFRQSDIMIIHGDIDGRSCDIAYTQYTLLGYAAIVCHQDGLSLEMYQEPHITMGWFIHSFPMRGVDWRRHVSWPVPKGVRRDVRTPAAGGFVFAVEERKGA